MFYVILAAPLKIDAKAISVCALGEGYYDI